MTNVAILGARGYAGREVLRILLRHPNIESIHPISTSSAGNQVGDHVASLGHIDLVFEGPQALAGADVVFLATDDQTSIDALENLEEHQIVIDLSRAHRQEGLAPGNQWQYGWADLEPVEAGTRRIANPGCFPTSAMLAMAPLLDSGMVGNGPIIVDGKSGISGAGATPRADLHFPEANESVRAYKVEGHDHGDEIQSATHRIISNDFHPVRFTPHLVPQSRGLLTTCYVPANVGIDPLSLQELVREFYADAPFVHLVDEPDTAAVRGSNHAHVSIHYDESTELFVARCAIDNLVKGAAGTAVQNMNNALGYHPTTGLGAIAG